MKKPIVCWAVQDLSTKKLKVDVIYGTIPAIYPSKSEAMLCNQPGERPVRVRMSLMRGKGKR